MILIALAVVCMLTVPLTGGRLSRLANLPLRWLWAAPAALILQIAITEVVPNVNHHTLAAVHVVSYVLVIAFLIANRRITGMWMIAIGALSNTLVIVANGGVMAASAHAQQVAGLVLDDRFHNSVVLANPRLLFLGDIIPVPGPLPNVLSPGDCVIFLGLLVLLHSQCHWRRSTEAEASDDGIVLSEVAPQEVRATAALLTGSLAMQSLAAASGSPKSAGMANAVVAHTGMEQLGTASAGPADAVVAHAGTEQLDTEQLDTESHTRKGLLRRATKPVVEAQQSVAVEDPNPVVAAHQNPVEAPNPVVAAHQNPVDAPNPLVAAHQNPVEAPNPLVAAHQNPVEVPNTVVEAPTVVGAPAVVAPQEAPRTAAETYGSVLGIGGLEVSAPVVVARRIAAPEVQIRLPDVLPRDEDMLAAQRIARLTWQAGFLGAAVGFFLNRRAPERVSPTP